MMRTLHIGVDTSCYTTSLACVDATGIVFDQRTMLSVPMGERGLRQGDGVFQHVKNLPPLIDALFAGIDRARIASIAYSARPVDAPGSYMPVFLAGRMAASALADALGVPCRPFSHQAGHVRAALLGNEALLAHERIFAFHLSGGTSDILDVRLEAGRIRAISRIGGSSDLHAGQLVDRIGVRLGLPFPCGRALEELARDARDRSVRIPASVRGHACSFSGAESALQRLLAEDPAAIEPGAAAYAVYDCLARTVGKLISQLPDGVPVLLGGGVSSSGLLKQLLGQRTPRAFDAAQPQLSGDNAVGTALLGRDAWRDGND